MPSDIDQGSPPPADPDRTQQVWDTVVSEVQSPIVKAACQAVVGVFDQLATEWPQLIRPQAPPHDIGQKFTVEMIDGLRAQLRRALGLEPERPE